MIGKLKGIVDGIYEDYVLIDVNGVGYEAFCAARTLGKLPALGQPVSLYIETIVREDFIKLYGFASEEERGWFRLLQSVQGVGAKVALAVLSTLTLSELSSAIAMGDKTTIARTPGVGPKVAQRIAAELKDKLPDGMGFGLKSDNAQAGNMDVPDSGIANDAISALTNLGYARVQAAPVVARLLQAEPEASLAVLIRKGLKELAG